MSLFLFGVFVGVFFGMLVMSMLVAAGDADDRAERMQK